MIKLLIVDDEQIERDGLELILQRSFPDLNIEKAKNGKIAVQMAGVFHPDIILMDIKMPGMNGLEAVEVIGAEFPFTKFVMVTAFESFEYARQAIKLGVKDYLLKPSKTSEIIATVGKVIHECIEERKSMNTYMLQQATLQKAMPLVETDIVTQLLFDHVHDVHLDMLIEMMDIPVSNELFVISVILPAGSEKQYGVIKEKINQYGGCWIGALTSRQLPIITFRDPNRSYRSQAIFLANEILAIAKGSNSSGWFVGLGSVVNSLSQIRQSYQESLIATMDTSQPVKYRFYGDVHIVNGKFDSELAKHREKQLFDQVRLGHWEDVRTNIQDMTLRYLSQGANLLQTQQRVFEIISLATRVLSEIGIKTETPLYSFQAQDSRQLSTETNLLIDKLQQAYTSYYDQVEPDAMNQIKQYILEHSHKDISLETLGKQVGLSPIYISKLFKEKLGVNYIDFLTECRIEKAKKLMSNPDKSLKEISFEVGYNEPNYFSKVFKKSCGLSPNEYRKTLLGKKE
ncbi:response regulator transcription factor [Bacillus marasmi]|uniref:response regulator transcription factor n=1 Tax=Bacillus marasmi TaxID=1926279 RepID=UPI0011C869BC|nr:response regulator [Bacillus marasmi]